MSTPALRQMGSSTSVPSLFERIQAGDNEAFNELYTTHYKRVFMAVKQFVHDVDAVEFLTNGVFAKVWQVRNTPSAYKGDSTLATWLTRIAYNEALMYIRKNKTEKRHVVYSLDGGSTNEESNQWIDTAHTVDFAVRDLNLEGIFDRKELAKAISALPTSYRVVFTMRLIDGLTIEETCSALNLGITVVKSRLFRGRRMVMDILNHKGAKKFKKAVAKTAKVTV